MKREDSRRTFHSISGISFILLIACFLLSNIFSNQKVAAQNSECPPIIDSATGSLVTIDSLNISLKANDCDGNTDRAQIRLLNGRNEEVFSSITVLNPPPPSRGPFDVLLLVNGLSNLLGSCTAEVRLIDKDNNLSTPRVINYRSCTQPIIGQFRVDPINGDKIRATVRGGDPDANTNQLIFELRNQSGSVLRGPDTLDITEATQERSDFQFFVESAGLSLLNNPGLVRVQLKDTRGNLSNTAEATFTAIKGQPDLASTLILTGNTFPAGGRIDLGVEVRNVGDAPAGASNGEVRLSKDQKFDDSDLLLDSFSVSALNPSNVVSATRTITIPSSTPAGSYFLAVISDTANAISEASKDNNIASRMINIQNTGDSGLPVVAVIAPKPGDVVFPGNNLKIIYNSSDNIGVASHSIDLSTDGGSSFNPIAANLAGSIKEFDFTVPANFTPPTANAVIRVIARDAAGNAGIGLSAPFTIGDTIKPAINLTAPTGGETINAGMAFNINFSASDNDMIAGITAAYSTDGGQTFPNLIGTASQGATSIIWNVPDSLVTTLGRIQVTARDRSGNTAAAMSGVFSIQPRTVTAPSLVVSISFTPPPAGVVAPPQDVRVNAGEVKTPATIVTLSTTVESALTSKPDLNQTTPGPELIGYNVYRVPEPPDGQPLPTAAEIVDPKNLVGAITAGNTTFTDIVPTDRSNSSNFVYSVTSFFGNGQMSNGSQPSGTDLPVIKNAKFAKGTIFLDAAGSFIKSGAMLIVNDNDAYRLQFDDSGTLFTVPKKTPSTGSGLTLKKILKKGATVKLNIQNPDGKMSVSSMFTRK